MAISNSGYWALSLAQTVEAAAIANHLSYLGGCFLLTCSFFCVLDLCNIRIPFSLHSMLVGISIVLYGLILSSGRTDWYYATMDITRENAVKVLVPSLILGLQIYLNNAAKNWKHIIWKMHKITLYQKNSAITNGVLFT